MLQIFRDKAQSTFIQAVVLVIALVFVFWGVGANMMDSREAAIVVNDEDISFQEYQRAYDQLLSTYRQQFGGAVPEDLIKAMGLDEQIRTKLIQEALLRQGTQAMGLRVSAPEVQKNIQEMVQFQENGAFDMNKYKAILQSNRLTPHKFETSMRYDTLSSKGVQAIGNFVTTVTDAEIRDMYQLSKESVTLSFAHVDPATFIDKVTVEEGALAAWYEQSKENYKTDPQVKLKFLSFPYDKENLENKPAVFKEANEAYEGIISAGSLQEYAKLNPEAVIQETDFYARATPPANIDGDPSVQAIAFSLKSGELSSLVESPDGYSILYADAIQEPQIPAMSAVQEKVTVDYREAEAKIMARKKSDEILTALRGNGDFAELAKKNTVELQEATLSRDPSGAGANGFPPSLTQDVFALNAANGLPEEPASVDDVFYLYQFTKRTLPDVASMTDEEKTTLKDQIISAKQERLLIAWIRHQEQDADIFTNKVLR